MECYFPVNNFLAHVFPKSAPPPPFFLLPGIPRCFCGVGMEENGERSGIDRSKGREKKGYFGDWIGTNYFEALVLQENVWDVRHSTSLRPYSN
ncbi:hypothetical protein CDAR_274191 [Caerostris darwini]|uniref:Uncharacterized protein n=1 Tax=Caerostris darwini TaxID=1538125 RepID=A0AAV4RHK0_9ARAC|nr:hypothetical protein CDAR_274191 [Caerostris darwini]